MKSSYKICLSSDGSWKLSTYSDTSLTSVRDRYVPEISQTVAATDSVTMVGPIDAKPISVTASDEPVTDEESNDQQSTDLQSIDEPATEEEPPTEPVIDEEPPTEPIIDEEPPTEPIIDEEPPAEPVYETCDHLRRVRLSQKLLSFDYSYDKDVCTDLQSLNDGDVTYKRPVQAKVVNLQKVRVSNPGGDMGNRKPIIFRCGASTNAKNMTDDKFRKRVASTDTMKKEGLVAAQRKPVMVKKTFKNKNNLIKNVYMSQTNKVSAKPAPFLRRSSSYINRQAMQRETDRNNYQIMRKLMNVKATVSSFR